MSLELTRVDPDDAAALDTALAVFAELAAADLPAAWPPPTRVGLEQQLRVGWDGEPPEVYLAYDTAREGEEPIGAGSLHLSEWDNRDLAWLGVDVRPGLRRRGHGARILGRLTEMAHARGRRLLGLDGWEGTAAREFAERFGYTQRSVEVARQHVLSEPGAVETAARLAAVAAEHAAAYELVRYPGRVPEDVIEGLVAVTAAINDAPTDDLDIEDDVITPQRIREYEAATLSARRMYRLVSRHRETGELVGHSVVAVEADRPRQGWQHDTTVVPAHRGHRLGMLLKASMVGWLADAEPELENLITWNAASNDPMIAVNEALGYRVVGRVAQFQKRLVSEGAVGG